MIDDDRLRWAETLMIRRLHGDDGPRWIAERVGELALAGDEAGIERFRALARCFDALIRAAKSRDRSRRRPSTSRHDYGTAKRSR